MTKPNFSFFENRRRFVSFLKILLIATLLAVLLVITIVCRFESNGEISSSSSGRYPVGQVVIEGLSLSIMDNSGRPVTINAEAVLKREKSTVTAEHITASFFINNLKMDANASKGLINLQDNILKLGGNVTMKSSEGDVLRCHNIDIYYAENLAIGAGPIELTNDFTSITAGNLEVIKNDIISFSSGVQAEIVSSSR